MYLDYFKLKELPFSLVADPRYLYLSENHAKVRAFLKYAFNVQDSFVVITGEIGSGKTTLINDALTSISANSSVINIQALHFTEEELLQVILSEIGIEPYQFSKLQMLEHIKSHLKRQHSLGRRNFLVIDEAQNLSKDVLNQVRYLSDLEVKKDKLLSVVIVGQPELNKVLDQPDMEHFLQRVRLRTHLRALDQYDIPNYVQHRLKVAGAKMTELFTDDAYESIYLFTGGRLRLINTLCDYALMYCFVEKQEKVTSWVVQKAAQELQWEPYEVRFGQYSDNTRLRNQSSLQSEPARLTITQNGKVVTEYVINTESVSIGRHKDNDINLDSHKVSRKHAQLVKQNDDYYLHDLNSTNGTYVNGEKINLHQLHDQDIFIIDQFKIQYIAAKQVLPDIPKSFVEEEQQPDVDKTRVLPQQSRNNTVRLAAYREKLERENS